MVIKNKYRGLIKLYKFVYYFSCLFVATINSKIRKKLDKYGEISKLQSKNIIIDLNIVDKNELCIEEDIYSSEESIELAYASGKYSYLPGFFD